MNDIKTSFFVCNDICYLNGVVLFICHNSNDTGILYIML